MAFKQKREPVKMPWYLVLISVTAPLLLYANNLGEVTLASLWRPVLFSALLGLILFGAAFLGWSILFLSYYSEKQNRYHLEEVQAPYDYCRDPYQ